MPTAWSTPESISLGSCFASGVFPTFSTTSPEVFDAHAWQPLIVHLSCCPFLPGRILAHIRSISEVVLLSPVYCRCSSGTPCARSGLHQMLTCVHNTCVWCHAGLPPDPSPISSDIARASRFCYFFTCFIMNHSFLSTIYKMFVLHNSPDFLTPHRPLLLWTTLIKPEVWTSYEA